MAIHDMFSFNLKYFLFALVIFISELLIALFVRDKFIRPYLGLFSCNTDLFHDTKFCKDQPP